MKKFLAVVLTFTLLLTALPVAFAATDTWVHVKLK